MTHKGHIKNGTLVLEDGTELPEGTAVEVAVIQASGEQAPASGKSWFEEHYAEVIGKAEGLPDDIAINHDHYLHGLPKK